MASSSPPTRRWFRFSLRTMFVVVTMVAATLGWELHVVRSRQNLLAIIEERHGFAEFPVTAEDRQAVDCGVALALYERPVVPYWREWLGDAPVECFLLPVELFSTDDALNIARNFPESEVWRIDADGNSIDAVNVPGSN